MDESIAKLKPGTFCGRRAQGAGQDCGRRAGACRPAGCHLSCFIVAGDGRRLGCLLFQRASNRLRRRDEWIGWDGRRSDRRLERAVCNSRFLILPRVRAENLASHALSLSAARLADGWQARWQVRPALVETFVDGRIREGASCRAAGWEHAGRSAGATAARARRPRTRI